MDQDELGKPRNCRECKQRIRPTATGNDEYKCPMCGWQKAQPFQWSNASITLTTEDGDTQESPITDVDVSIDTTLDSSIGYLDCPQGYPPNYTYSSSDDSE